MRHLIKFTLILLMLAPIACRSNRSEENIEQEAQEPQHTILYGIIADNYHTENGSINQGETLGKILARYGVSAVTVDKLDKVAKDVFPLNKIKADWITLFTRRMLLSMWYSVSATIQLP